MSIIWLAAFSFINVRPIQKDEPTKQSWYLRSGAELLRLFLITATANLLMVCAYFVYFRSVLFDEVCAGMFFKGIWVLTILNLAGMAVLETIFFGTASSGFSGSQVASTPGIASWRSSAAGFRS